MTPHEYQEQQKARVMAMYSNTNDLIEKAPAAPEASAPVNTGAAAPTTESTVTE